MRFAVLVPLLVSPFAGGCSFDESPIPAVTVQAAPPELPVTLSLAISNPGAAAGTRIAVAIRAQSDQPGTLAGLTAVVRYDSTAVRYLGITVPEHPAGPIVANGRRPNRVTIVAVGMRHLEPQIAVLIFQVVRSDGALTISIDSAVAASPARTETPVQLASGRIAAPDLVVTDPVVLTDQQWADRLGHSVAEERGLSRTPPGTPVVYGDANLNGPINVFDVLLVQRIAAGVDPVPTGDSLEVSNVAPANTADGVEATLPDACRPGRACTAAAPFSETGPGAINVFDALAVANHAAGVVVPVVGKPVPLAWPILTGRLPTFDTSRTVTLPGDTTRLYRTSLRLIFKPGVSDSAKAALFAQFGMTVIGWYPTSGIYFVTIPDPGTDINDLYSVSAAVRASPVIQFESVIFMSPGAPRLDARFPDDGIGMKRADYFSTASGSATWAVRAVRLPLAWGCEQGTYAGAPAEVGNIEWRHEAAHPEYAASTIAVRAPSDSLLISAKAPVPPSASLAGWREHGTMTTGAVTARGDNRGGVAGPMWRTGLYQLSMTSPDSGRPYPIKSTVQSLIDAWKLDQGNIRVVTIQSDLEISAGSMPAIERQESVNFASSELKTALFDRYPQVLVVVPTGNWKIRGPLSQYVLDPKGDLLKAALFQLRDSANYRDRIVVVGGTDEGNRFWTQSAVDPAQGSNFITGRTDLAAPAGNVVGLTLWSGQPDSLVPVGRWHGTSIASPVVAGVAAQLLTMDPTLTPAQVKDYLIRGAMVPKPDSTGIVVPAAPVLNAPGTIYQLDAYGALTLLAQERANVPVCGNEVTYDIDGKVVVLRNPGPTQTIAPAAAVVGDISVAQGGRLMVGIDVGTSRFPKYFKFQGSYPWAQTGPGLNDIVGVQFLERDTAFVKFAIPGDVNAPLLLSVVGPGRNVPYFDPGSPIGHPNRTRRIDVAPDGQWVAFRTDPASASEGYGQYADSIGRNSPVTLKTYPPVACSMVVPYYCANFPAGSGPAVWAHDSRWVTTIDNKYDQYQLDFFGFYFLNRTWLSRFLVSTGAATSLSVENNWLFNIVLSGDDAVWRECRQPTDGSTYNSAFRNAKTLSVIPGSGPCPDQFGSVIPNGPPSTVSARVAKAVAGRETRRGTRGN